jgi:hypothetical protein
MTNANKALCGLPGMSAHLEYIPLTTDPTRGLPLPGLPDDSMEEMDGPGPLMSFVLSLGQYFTAGALFAAVALMLMVAGAGM